MFSIRRFLMAALVSVILGGGVLLGWGTYHTLYHELDEQYDAELVQSTRLMAAFWGDDAPAPRVARLEPSEQRYQRYFVYQLWRRGELVLASDGAPREPLIPLTDPQRGGRYLEAEGWHTYALPLAGARWVIVAESDRARRSLVANTAATVLAPYLLSVPVILLLVWLAVRWGLRPLTRLARSVSVRDANNLTPLRHRPVRELAPLTEAINTLLARLVGTLEREKRFTADAAHELRTLLMALRLHADNAAQLDDPQEVAASLSQLTRAVDRAGRTVEQLMQLSRLDPQRAAAGDRCDLVAVARDCITLIAPLAEQRRQTVALEGPPHLWVAMPAEVADMLIRNLLDNACRYSPEGAAVGVRIAEAEGQARVEVSDGGPGLTGEQQRRFTGRFSRGRQDVPGAGLGLSIVDRILSIYGGALRFRLRDEDRPAAAVMTLPRG
ncbi:two-component sensor histidine kinase [Alcanivorax marinus]|uniref:histidine kinase n=1 Tax=Alloalcanivorax marinus TaxID=1177169 RepID=A0A9Q3UKI6_9GAMM|nr:ATP-binding protein [Alloalcanivorax marinus]MCC4307179.1 two-component sensor histidine kinase [Alloalcanivorax marinus]MCH2558419.1 ATP-binding protein [Alcanivorax sp.]MCU5787073.1 sensor histidine kinase [Alloalcanivorax marinus]